MALGSHRILYIGNFAHDGTTEWEIAEGLEQLGQEVERVQEDTCHWNAIAAQAKDGGADAVFWTRTLSRNRSGERRMLETLANMGIPTVGLHLDRYVGLQRETQLHEEPWWRCDQVFTADGGNQDVFAAAGINHRWMPPATREAACFLGEARDEYRSDVAFVGSWQSYHPEWPHRRDLVAWLSDVYGERFGLWPRKEPIRGRELNDLCASVKVLVGDSCLGGHRYWSDRIPRTFGAGGLLLHPAADELRDFWPTLGTWPLNDWDLLSGTISLALAADEDSRHRARRRNVSFAKLIHTWRSRLRGVLHYVFPDENEWRGEVRPATTDEIVLREIFDEDVYRARDNINPGDVVVDLGSNVGMFTSLALALGAREVHAVEPSFALNQLATLNVKDARATGQTVGIGGTRGQAVIEDGEYGGASGRTVPGDGPVEIVPLDDVLSKCRRVDFLKCDVEGAEWDAFATVSHEALARVDYIAMEFHPHDPHAHWGLGRLVEKLSRTHRIEVLGQASTGGYLWAKNNMSVESERR